MDDEDEELLIQLSAQSKESEETDSEENTESKNAAEELNHVCEVGRASRPPEMATTSPADHALSQLPTCPKSGYRVFSWPQVVLCAILLLFK
ncbi:hypothetical protein E2C01_047848 [Portunus trituberculatus]|uniref:Uncharacterized protein n=1 Tax=Portunus trituberculatus TaxID=210409 RepID=A0A5B7G8Z3_PORTR|nr:hypothetical protein [Portunus trituberculatus]